MRSFVRVAAAPVLLSLVLPTLATPPDRSVRATRNIPIDHIVVLMQENRSFDHYFGMLHYQGQPEAGALPLDSSNPNPLKPGARIRVFHKKLLCDVADVDHSWTQMHHEYAHGTLEGFTTENAHPKDPTGRRSMGYYTRRDLPFYYWLYSTFPIGDRYFASVLGPTFPNRFYLLAGTSFGYIRNIAPDDGGFTQKTVFELLDAAGVSWKVYYAQTPFESDEFRYVRERAADHVFPIRRYYFDADAGNLPQVSFIDPIFRGHANVENDEHPPSNPQVGQRFVRKVIGALTHSPDWPSSALFLTYDEAGGYYDHVPPPKAIPPDDIPPRLKPGDTKAGFGRYGFRVPVVVVSPWSRAHHVSHATYDHTSILRFIELRFGLPTLTRRDAAAKPMLSFFDFSHRSFATPPKLPAAPIDPDQAAICATRPIHHDE